MAQKNQYVSLAHDFAHFEGQSDPTPYCVEEGVREMAEAEVCGMGTLAWSMVSPISRVWEH